MLEGVKGIGIFLMKVVFIPPLILIGVFLALCLLNYLYLRIIKKHKPIKPDEIFDIKKEHGFLRKLLLDFPKQLAIDILSRTPYEFREYGLHMVCGRQGSGKTMTVVYLLQKWKNKYPKMKICTNLGYKYQDYELNHWKDLICYKNGIYGIANVIDEIQTWFNSLESKDFPIEMIEQISQQRKQRKCLIGTAQVFSRIAKPIREQTHFVYMPFTIAGCLTVVRKTKPEYWDDEKQKFKKYTGTFFFVHNKELREAYDTYKIIEKYKDVGMYINPQLLNATTNYSKQTFTFNLKNNKLKHS